MIGRGVSAGQRRQKLRRLAIVAGKPFSPDDIASLSAWYDAEDNSLITENPAGQVQNINTKTAKPPNKNYNNTNPGQKPALVTVAGHQMIQFDGTSDWWADTDSNAVLQPGAGDFSIVMLARINAGVSASAPTWVQRDAGGVELWQMNLRGSVVFSARDGAGNLASLVASDETFNDGSTRWILIGTRTSSELNLYYASVASPTLQASSSNPVNASAVGDVDAVNSAVGRLPDVATTFWRGEFGESFFFKSALPEPQRNAMAGYLARKWA